MEKVVAYDRLKKSQRDNLGNYEWVSLTSVPGRIMERAPLEHISWHTKVNESLQRGFTKNKSYLTSLLAFCDKMTGFVNEGRTQDLIYFNFNEVDAVHVNFSKAFNVVSHNIHASKLGICSLDAWTTRRVSSSLDGSLRGAMINGSYTFFLGAGNEQSTAGLSCDLSCLTSLSVNWRKW